jgi:hypothetical protein
VTYFFSAAYVTLQQSGAYQSDPVASYPVPIYEQRGLPGGDECGDQDAGVDDDPRHAALRRSLRIA